VSNGILDSIDITSINVCVECIKGKQTKSARLEAEFYNPKLKTYFETRTVTFFEDIEFGGKNKVSDFVFEEESGTIPYPIHTVAFDEQV